MPAGSRPSRIADQLRVELSELITRQVHDPGIGFLTITHVKVTPDLQQARVYYTSLGDDKARRESARALERAAPFLRRQIGSRLRLKRVPQLEFFFDESIARGNRIEQILHELDAERSSASVPPEGGSHKGGVEEGGSGRGGLEEGGSRTDTNTGTQTPAEPDQKEDDE